MKWRISLFVPAIILGVLVYHALQPKDIKVVEATTSRAPAILVDAFRPLRKPVRISIEGFGRVEPVRTWEAVSQVDGRIIVVMDDLADGTVFQEGNEILRIDSRSYEIARDMAAANLQSAEAELNELDAQALNIREQLVLERRIEDVFQVDFNRRSALVQSGTSAASTLDQVQRDLITQQRRVLDLDNQLELLPVQRITYEAAVRSRRVELEDAERDLANTIIVAPFTGRVIETSSNVGEYVRQGDHLLTIMGLEAVEVSAQINPIDISTAFKLLLPNVGRESQSIDFYNRNELLEIFRIAKFQAIVQPAQDNTISYSAQIVRIDGTVNEKTGNLGIIVRIKPPDIRNDISHEFLLTKGSLAKVELKALTPAAWQIVPRSILHNESSESFIYVADADDKLARRNISRIFSISGKTIIDVDLLSEDRILLRTPNPPIQGQPLIVSITSEPNIQ